MYIKTRLKHIIPVFFIAFILTYLLAPTLVLVNFKVNQTYYEQNLCVEKDIPESTCKGKCQLNQQLEAVTANSVNNQKEDFNFDIKYSSINLFFIINKSFKFTSKLNTIFYNCRQKDEPTREFKTDVFHPPKG